MKDLRLMLGDSSYCYDYDVLIDSFDCEVLVNESVGSYQGDTFVLLRRGDEYGFLNFGWGSCSYCDALQACNGIEDLIELRDSLYNSIVWRSEREAGKYAFEHDFEGDYAWYYSEYSGYKYLVQRYFAPSWFLGV